MHDLHTHVDVDVPAEALFAVLVDFPSYTEWNPYIRKIGGALVVGEKLAVSMHAGKNGPSAFTPTVVRYEPGRAFAWLGTYIVPGLLDGEHTFEVEARGASASRLVHREVWRGLVWRIHRRFWIEGTTTGFHAMNGAIKRRAESLDAVRAAAE
jgi:hypothetical protein